MINCHFVSRFATKPWEFGPRWLWYFDFERDGTYRASSETLFAVAGENTRALPPEDRPAVVVVLSFDATGAFVGPATMVRADHYHGQQCESTRAPYIYFPLIGYYFCVRTAGD